MLPALRFSTEDEFHAHIRDLHSKSYTSLVSEAAGGRGKTRSIVLIFAALAYLRETESRLSGNNCMELFTNLRTLFTTMDLCEVLLVPDHFADLVRQIGHLKLPAAYESLRLWLLHLCAARSSGGSPKHLTVAHLMLMRNLGPSSARFDDVLFKEIHCTFDPKYGKPLGDELYHYFRQAAQYLHRKRELKMASIHASIALAVCRNPNKLESAFVFAQAHQVLAYGCTLSQPYFLKDMVNADKKYRDTREMVERFNALNTQTNPDIGQFRALCRRWCQAHDLGHLEPSLVLAYKIAWLHAVGRIIKRCDVSILAQCGPCDLDRLLDHGYQARVSMTADGTIIESVDQRPRDWLNLEVVLQVTQQLAKCRVSSRPISYPSSADIEEDMDTDS